MGFLDDIKNKAGALGDKAGDAFEVAKDKAGDLVDAAKDKLDTDDDGDVDTADAKHAFEGLKGHATGGGDAPADQVAAAAGAAGAGAAAAGAGTEYTIPEAETVTDTAADPEGSDLVAEEAVVTEDVGGDPVATPLDDPIATPLDDPIATPLDGSVDSAEATKDEALADLQAKAEDLQSDET
jgi:hypothetical protein